MSCPIVRASATAKNLLDTGCTNLYMQGLPKSPFPSSTIKASLDSSREECIKAMFSSPQALTQEMGLDTAGAARPANDVAPTHRSSCVERIRLALIIDFIGDWDQGGTERHIVRLLRTLDPHVFEPTIFVLQPTPSATAKQVGCPVQLIGGIGKQSRLRRFLSLRKALKRFQPHIVQTFFIDGMFYGTIAAWLNRVPVIVQSRRNAGYWQKFHHTLALRVLNRAVNYWQCNARFVAAGLASQEGIPQERISVLPNSVDLSYFSPATAASRQVARNNLGLPADAPVFVVVSTLRPIKGLPVFIEAAGLLQTSLPNAVFLIVGDGAEQKTLAEQIRNARLNDIVRMVGGHADVRPWLRAADIAVLPSHSESSSNALLEYMAMGLPAVVSDIPANRELVEGEFFEPGSAAGLAERILRLWNQPERRQAMARQNREAAMQYGDVTFSHRVQDYYFALASSHLKDLNDRRQLED
ncbi:MAG TPA: glycosyltransferase [Candidatus Sulfotelmatobacter sp.]|nr:glycosyltransferase [Candidatus Sulfotelmatobacter sp.]